MYVQLIGGDTTFNVRQSISEVFRVPTVNRHEHAPPSSKMSSSTSKLRRCPHKCGCTYASGKSSHIKRHTDTRHRACNPGCPFYDPLGTGVVTPDGVAPKQVERRNQPAVQERNEPPTRQFIVPSTRRVANSVDKESHPDHHESSDSSDADPPPSRTKPDRSRMAGRSQIERTIPNRADLSHAPKILAKARGTMSVFDPPHRRTMQKATEKLSSTTLGSTPSQSTSAPTQLATPAKSTPPHVTSNPEPDAIAADPSPSPSPEPNQNRTSLCHLPESPPTQSTHTSPEPDIESLYASPSSKTVTELVPIELDSDQDFEMTERMLSSHRGPLSQSQRIKTEPTAQSSLSQAERPLKRRRSQSSPNKSSQAPTRSPQADSRSTKRPRVDGSHSPKSTVVLNDRRKHPEFWDLDGTVILQVDNVLFRVMRSTLSKASPWFQHLFSEDLDHLEIMAGCPVYIIEEDFNHLDFANLLRGLENGL